MVYTVHAVVRFILENLSTTTKINSLPFFYLGKPKTKSIEISKQGLVDTNNGVYSPCDCTLNLAFLQAMHCSQDSLHIPFYISSIKMLMQYTQSFRNPKVIH
jgi:hypothetical protein